MMITKDWLEHCRTPKGGITFEQLRVLGDAGLIEKMEKLTYPKTGWMKALVGRLMSDENAMRFYEARLIKHGNRKKTEYVLDYCI